MRKWVMIEGKCPKCNEKLYFSHEENCEVEFYDCYVCNEAYVVEIEIVRDWKTMKGSQDYE